MGSYTDGSLGPSPQGQPASLLAGPPVGGTSWFMSNTGIKAAVLLPQDHSQVMRLSGSGIWQGDPEDRWRTMVRKLYESSAPLATQGGDTLPMPLALACCQDKETKGDDGYDNSLTCLGAEQGRGVAVDSAGQPVPTKGILMDWSNEYSMIQSLPDKTTGERLLKYQQLCSLYENFLFFAVTFGKIIVSEMYVSEAQKTIKPINGGFAGGQKFLYHGIFFKFACDDKGLHTDDYYAAKVGGHELKSAMRFSGVRGLNVPLMALIDYRGFRLVAMSWVPTMGEHTIVYGSCDANKDVVHRSNDEFTEMIEGVAHSLNLKPHVCGSVRPQRLMMPVDFEGHAVRDGEGHKHFYALDFARVFPPAFDNTTPFDYLPNSYLVRLLRPEFVTSWKEPLSSDACSRFGEHDREAHDSELERATRYLVEHVVPECAAWLDSQKGLSQTDVMVQVHRRGINYRYLGLVRSKASNPGIRKALLCEMIARVCKNWLGALQRAQMRAATTIEEDAYKVIAVNFFNYMLSWPFRMDTSAEFWKDIKPRLMSMYPNCLSKKEKADTYSLQGDVDMVALFQRVQELTGIKLRKSALEALKLCPRGFKVVISDIKSMNVVLKHMNIVSFSEGALLAIQSASAYESNKSGSLLNKSTDDRMVFPPRPESEGDTENFAVFSDCSERLFNMALRKLDLALQATPDNAFISNEYADILINRVTLVKREQTTTAYLEKAIELYRSAHNVRKLMELGEELYNNTFLLATTKSLALCMTCCKAAHELRPEHTESLYLCSRALVKRFRLTFEEKCMEDAGANLAQPGVLPPEQQWIATIPTPRGKAFALELCEWGMKNGTMCINRCCKPELTMSEVFWAFTSHVGDKDSQVKGFDLSRCSTLNSEIVERLLPHIRSLSELCLASCDGLCRLDAAALLQSAPQLKLLDVSDCVNIESGEVAGPITNSLSGLYASGCNKYAHTLEALLTGNSSTLVSLDLSSVGFLEPVKKHTCLKALILNNCLNANLEGLPEYLRGQTNLEVLELNDKPESSEKLNKTLFLDTEACTHLKKLGVNRMKGVSFAMVLKKLESTPSLTSLSINSCFENIDMKNITEHFPANMAHLTELNAENSKLSVEVVKKLIQEFGDNLKVLKIARNKGVDSCIITETMEHVDLEHTSVKKLEVRDGSSLTFLSLNGCPLSAEALCKVAMLTELRTLLLDSTKCDPNAVKAITRMCGENLRTLHLSRCKMVNDKCLQYVARMCPNLEVLDLTGSTLVTDAPQMDGHLMKLRELRLRDCAGLTNAFVQKIAHLPALEVLDICGCVNLTDEIMGCFVQGFESLRTLVLGGNKISRQRMMEVESRRRLVIEQNGGEGEDSEQRDINASEKGASHGKRRQQPRLGPGAVTSSIAMAKKRLLQDLEQVRREPLPTISALPVSDKNLFVWHANLYGLPGTHYEGGIFHMEIEFPGDYPSRPPTIKMLTPLPHPHVFQQQICIDILDNFRGHFSTERGRSFSGWSSAYTVQSILIQLQAFLFNVDDTDGSLAAIGDIPEAVRHSRFFVCGQCAHSPQRPWPDLPCLKSFTEQSAAERRAVAATGAPDETWRCYYTRESWRDTVIGFGWQVTARPNQRQDPDHPEKAFRRLVVEPFLEPLSYTAFAHGVRSSIQGCALNAFTPLYINAEHGARIRDILLACINSMPGNENEGAAFTPAKGLKVLTYMMNAVVVAWFRHSTLWASENGVLGYCACHRLLLYLAGLYPALVEQANARIRDFVRDPTMRHKDRLPDLGCFVQSLCVSDYHWEDVRDAAIDECLHRSVLYVLKREPALQKTELDARIDATRIQRHFAACCDSLRLMLFNRAFLERLGRPRDRTLAEVAHFYDAHNGIVPDAMKERLMADIHRIERVQCFEDFYAELGVPCPSPMALTIRLLDVVRHSAEAGYHAAKAPSKAQASTKNNRAPQKKAP